MQALAYTRGANIHIGPGQEQHLPHEAWHYVQQAQGRVKPTLRQGQEILNDDAFLEREADVMGMRAMSEKSAQYEAVGRSRVDGEDNKQAPLNTYTHLSASPVMQLRRVALTYLNSSGGIDAGMSIETNNVPWKKLEDMLFNESLSSQSKLELMRAIDAGEVQGGYPGALESATGHLGFMRANLPAEFGDENEFTWIRRITGGGPRSLTGKRERGAIKTDMSEEEYVATEEITRGFYGTADRLNVAVPREHFLTLYRGFTIPALKQQSATGSLVENIEGYSDVLPSSSSWQREQAIEMSKPGEGESAVLMYMAIPQDHPIVIMSYPDNENTSGTRPKPLDIGQAEVLIGASSNQNVEIFKTEQLPNGRIRYHVSTTLLALGADTVMAGIKRARDQAAATRPLPPQTLDLESEMLVGRFGADESARIVSESATESEVSRIYRDVDGKSWKLISGDPHFGYTFSSVE